MFVVGSGMARRPTLVWERQCIDFRDGQKHNCHRGYPITPQAFVLIRLFPCTAAVMSSFDLKPEGLYLVYVGWGGGGHIGYKHRFGRCRPFRDVVTLNVKFSRGPSFASAFQQRQIVPRKTQKPRWIMRPPRGDVNEGQGETPTPTFPWECLSRALGFTAHRSFCCLLMRRQRHSKGMKRNKGQELRVMVTNARP